MAILQIQNLTFSYPGSYDAIFTAASAQLDTNWKLGLVGRNGRGKTTLLRLLQGAYPYAGQITAPRACHYFPFAVQDPAAPVAAMAQSLLPALPPWQFLRELGRLGLAQELAARPFCTLSPGEQTRVMLAVLFLQPGGYPLIDEPTNHLDAAGRAQLGAYLRGQAQGFLLVSHDRALLDACTDHTLAIGQTGLQVTQGNFSAWWQETCRRNAREAAEHERLTGEIARLRDAKRRTADWSDKVEKTKNATRNSGLRPDRGYVGHKSAKMMKRAKCMEARREDAITQKSLLLKEAERADPLKLTPLAHPKACLLRAQNLTVQYAGAAPVCSGVSFAVQGGDRLALTGRNGCGKSSLLRLAVGEHVPHTGTLTLASGLKISYVPQTAGVLHGTPAEYAARCGVDTSLFLTILRKFGFERVQFEKQMEDLSEGQKKKLLLARSLCEQAHLYVWDEPLNYIDLYARIQIENLILESCPTLLFVEHDAAFCEKVCTGQVAL